MLNCLIYVSAASELFSDESLARLLRHGAEKNARCGITGVLLYIGGNFMHLLEGEESIVSPLYEQIERDPRHRDVRLIIKIPIAHRYFSGVPMGFKDGRKLPPTDLPGILALLRDAARPEIEDRAGAVEAIPSVSVPQIPVGKLLLERFAASMAL